MEVIIRKYQDSDKEAPIKCLESLVDCLVPLDPLKRCRRLPEFGKEHTESLLKKIKEHNFSFCKNFCKSLALTKVKIARYLVV